tara:strand:+ start:189 stop:476 length:288 start_codon:yes stop_codon:yes gene_type:complete
LASIAFTSDTSQRSSLLPLRFLAIRCPLNFIVAYLAFAFMQAQIEIVSYQVAGAAFAKIFPAANLSPRRRLCSSRNWNLAELRNISTRGLLEQGK